MKIIGLTGNIASGKTEVAGMLREFGAKIIDADALARSIVEPGKPAWGDIVNEFGESVLNEDRTINRRILGDIIFNNEAKRIALNDITHPRIIEEIRALIEQYKHEQVSAVIIEAALIVEKAKGINKLIDSLIVVVTDEQSQIQRLRDRNGLTADEAAARINSQMPSTEKAKHADNVIDNSGALGDTKIQVQKLWEKLISSE